MSFGSLKRIAKLLLPPIVTKGIRLAWRGRPHQPALEYAPDGWKTMQDDSPIVGWNVENVVKAKKAEWETFCRQVQGTGPLLFSPESADLTITQKVSVHNVYFTYAYALALAAHQKTCISVLDYGGGLGHFYQVGRALLPDVTLDFHCKEVPIMAETGKLLNPEAHWYTDDSCLERSYDLVMINSSLQYIEDWESILQRIARAAQGYLLLMRIPVIDKRPSFAAIQRIYGTEMLHWQLNQDAVLKVVEDTGLRLMREVYVGDRPYIQDAPEQCELRGWLFKKETL